MFLLKNIVPLINDSSEHVFGQKSRCVMKGHFERRKDYIPFSNSILPLYFMKENRFTKV